MFAPTTEGIDKMTITELMRSERIGYLEAKRRVETSEQMSVGSTVESTDRDALVWSLRLALELVQELKRHCPAREHLEQEQFITERLASLRGLPNGTGETIKSVTPTK